MHNKECSCYDCNTKHSDGDSYLDRIKARGLKAYTVDSTGRYGESYADAKPASYYLDSELIAREPVTAYKIPSESGEVVKVFPQGSKVGIIQSYVVRDGQVWWEMDWFSRKHMGWVKHSKNLFDSAIAEQTASGKTHQQTVEKINKILTEKSAIEKLADGVSSAAGGIGDSIGFLGKNLKYILIAAIVFVVVLQISKARA